MQDQEDNLHIGRCSLIVFASLKLGPAPWYASIADLKTPVASKLSLGSQVCPAPWQASIAGLKMQVATAGHGYHCSTLCLMQSIGSINQLVSI